MKRLERCKLTVAEDIAHAVLYIASVDHYMVGLAAEGLSFDDLSDAKQILIDMENADSKGQHRYDLAFTVLEAYCQSEHRCSL